MHAITANILGSSSIGNLGVHNRLLVSDVSVFPDLWNILITDKNDQNKAKFVINRNYPA